MQRVDFSETNGYIRRTTRRKEHVQRSSRRKFLKRTALGTLVLTAAKALPAPLLTDVFPEDVPQDLLYFSRHEYRLIRALASRMVGEAASGTREIDVALRADRYLSAADPEAQDQFHTLLTVFNSPLFAFLFDFRFSSFLDMSSTDQDSYIEDWMASGLEFRRTGFQALKRTCLSMYYTDARSFAEIGYHGMFLPTERP